MIRLAGNQDPRRAGPARLPRPVADPCDCYVTRGETLYSKGKAAGAEVTAALRVRAYTCPDAGGTGLASSNTQMSTTRLRRGPSALLGLLFASLCFPAAAGAQPDQPASPTGSAELNVINVPTTTSLDRHQSYFRLTHRFSRDLRRGDLASLAEDFFSLDSGAVIGLEYRFGVTSDLQAGVHRTTLSKTIQFFGRYDRWRQSASMPVAISILGSVEGLGNFQDHYQPGIGVTLSRTVSGRLSLYATPTFVAHTQADDTLTGHDHGLPGEEVEDEHSHHDSTTFLGLGARVRILPTAFVSAEYSPRVAGHDPGRGTWAVGIEKQTAGHIMQLNVTNSFGTTLGETARGGSPHDVYLGFNLIRRF